MKLPFPLGVANPFTKVSISERHLMLARFYAVWKSAQMILPPDQANYQLVMLVSKNDLPAAQVSLASARKHARKMPAIHIACDTSLPISVAKDALPMAAGVNFWTVEAVARQLQDQGHTHLAQLCTRHVFGYKLAVCAMLSIKGRVLYADTDILWRANPLDLIEKNTDLPLYASSDYQASYDNNLIKILPRHLTGGIDSAPFVNAGLFIMNVPLAGHPVLLEILAGLPPQFALGHFTEQTIVAILAKKLGGIMSRSEVEVLQPGEFDGRSRRISRANQAKFASHFVTPVRKYFWHEAAGVL